MNIGAFLVLLDLTEELPSIFSTAEPEKFVPPVKPYTPPHAPITKKIYGIPSDGWGENLRFQTVFLPEDFELVGPSRIGLTRPAGLD